MKKRIVATIEARMTSSRLPGKVLLPCKWGSMLDLLVDRLRQVPSVDEIVLATTTNTEDDVLVQFAERKSLQYHRGSEHNVLQRVLDAARNSKADIIVEITGDCPLIDANIIEQAIQIYCHNHFDYVSNCVIRSYPIGMDVQVYAWDLLYDVMTQTNEPLDLEHVTRYIRQRPNQFKLFHLMAQADCQAPHLALTLDEQSDYELLNQIIDYFEHPHFTCSDILHLLNQKHPAWININQGVSRKGLDA